MRKSLIFVGILAIGFANAQEGKVGINTDNPKATLEITLNTENAKTGAKTNEGILAPRLSKVRIANIEEPVEGTLVYVIDEITDPISAYTGNDTKVEKIIEKGYYHYNGKQWVSNNDKNIYNTDGTLATDRTVEGGGGGKKLVFNNLASFQINKGTDYFSVGRSGRVETSLDYMGQNGVFEKDLMVEGQAIATRMLVSNLSGIGDRNVVADKDGNLKIGTSTAGTGENIYNSNGLLAGERTVTMNGHNLIFTGNGNIGIGITTTPTDKLTVAGDIRTNSVIYNSDARLKTGVADISNATATINGLRSVTYTWNDLGKKRGGNEKLQYGFIAQEVEKVLPALVNTDAEGYKSVNYVAVVPMLVKALQEKDEELKALKAEVEVIKKALKK